MAPGNSKKKITHEIWKFKLDIVIHAYMHPSAKNEQVIMIYAIEMAIALFFSLETLDRWGVIGHIVKQAYWKVAKTQVFRW